MLTCFIQYLINVQLVISSMITARAVTSLSPLSQTRLEFNMFLGLREYPELLELGLLLPWVQVGIREFLFKGSSTLAAITQVVVLAELSGPL